MHEILFNNCCKLDVSTHCPGLECLAGSLWYLGSTAPVQSPSSSNKSRQFLSIADILKQLKPFLLIDRDHADLLCDNVMLSLSHNATSTGKNGALPDDIFGRNNTDHHLNFSLFKI